MQSALCLAQRLPGASWPRVRSRRPTTVMAAAAAPPPGGEPAATSTGEAVQGGAAAAPRFTTRLEHMDTLALHTEPGGDAHRYAELDLAETELGTYCSRLGPEEQPEKCWQAYSYLERRREAATDSCDWQEPASCEDLEKLNTMAHDLLATGSMDDLVATFSTLARVEEMRASRAAKQAEAAAHPEPPAQEDYLHVLFRNMDTNGDGQLSMAEFRQAMAMLGDELDGATVSLIGDAMDVHGFLSEQQFRDIVEAERINSKSEVAQLWRHHHLKPRHHS